MGCAGTKGVPGPRAWHNTNRRRSFGSVPFVTGQELAWWDKGISGMAGIIGKGTRGRFVRWIVKTEVHGITSDSSCVSELEAATPVIVIGKTGRMALVKNIGRVASNKDSEI